MPPFPDSTPSSSAHLPPVALGAVPRLRDRRRRRRLIRRRRTEIARALLAEGVEPPRSDEAIARASGFAGERALKRALHDLHQTTALRLRRAAVDPEMTAEQSRIEVGALLDR